MPDAGVAHFINDMNAFARPEWLGNDPQFKKQLEDVARLGKQLLTQEELYTINTKILTDHYNGNPPTFDKMKPAQKQLLKRICDSSSQLVDLALRYQQAMGRLLDDAVPVLLERLAEPYGLDVTEDIAALKSYYQRNGGFVDNMVESISVPRLLDAKSQLSTKLKQDMAKISTMTGDPKNQTMYFRDEKSLKWLTSTFNEPKAAAPLVILSAAPSINLMLTEQLGRYTESRDHMRAHWPEGFQGLQK